ncbi:hypothetical protein F4604DRAFT_1932352 [Suillus subluteus]|nr:hypothetical protein F4604DRAFT_1932352 [Suillus subluteus]
MLHAPGVQKRPCHRRKSSIMRPTRLSWTILDPCDPQLASYSSDGLSQLKNDAIEKVQMLVPVKEAERSYAFDASKLGSFTVDEDPLKSVLHEVVKDFQGPFWTGSRSPSSGPTVLHDPHVVISFWRKSFQMPVQLCHRSPDLSFASPRIVFLLHSVTKILRMKRGHYCIAFGSYHQFE